MWSLWTAPDTRIPSTAHPARSGEKYCTTLIFLISLIYLSYRFLPFAIIVSVGKTYESMRDVRRQRGAWRGWRELGAVPRYIQFYNNVLALLSLLPLALHANIPFNNNMRHIWINRSITVPFILFITKSLKLQSATKHTSSAIVCICILYLFKICVKIWNPYFYYILSREVI